MGTAHGLPAILVRLFAGAGRCEPYLCAPGTGLVQLADAARVYEQQLETQQRVWSESPVEPMWARVGIAAGLNRRLSPAAQFVDIERGTPTARQGLEYRRLASGCAYSPAPTSVGPLAPETHWRPQALQALPSEERLQLTPLRPSSAREGLHSAGAGQPSAFAPSTIPSPVSRECATGIRAWDEPPGWPSPSQSRGTSRSQPAACGQVS